MDWKQLRLTAETTAKEAGKVLREGASQLKEVQFQDAHDVKLRADMESEELIRKLLGEATAFPVYGEEKGGDTTLATRYDPYWVVDPLDGTFNYLRGSAICCVSIGLMRGETPLLGVIYDFNSGDLFSGVVTEGLLVNGKAPAGKWADTRDQAALATGFPAGMERSAARMEAFISRITPFKKVRMVGSAALALAYVASGVFDVYFEESINIWDVAAGLALVQAAGGVVRMTPCRSGKPMVYDVWAGKEAFFEGRERD